MFEFGAACCCPPPGPCPCASIYTSLTVKWTGSVRFSPMDCREYFRRWANGQAGCTGFRSRFAIQQAETFDIGSIVVPALNPTNCSTTVCIPKVRTFNRYYQSFEPAPGSPESRDPRFLCQFQTLDNIFGPYQIRFNHTVSVFAPTTSGAVPRPFWRVRIDIGTVVLSFRSVREDFGCYPDAFTLEPDRSSISPDSCNSLCGVTSCVSDCQVLNPPPPPQTWPGTGFAGPLNQHEVDINIGTVQVG